MRFILFLITIGILFTQQIHPKLAGFKDFVGKTWTGEFPVKEGQEAQIDVQTWSLDLNGQAIKIRHSINNGSYGGESMLIYNSKKKVIEFYYFTTAGFYTKGTVEVKNNVYTSHEYVIGNEDGITEVKGIATLTKSGDLHVKSIYFKQGKWIDDGSHDLVYKLTPDAIVKFK